MAELSLSQQPAANLDQSRNGLFSAPTSPIEWQNGNVNSSQAHMVEDYSNPYRVVMTNMPTNGTVVTLDIEWDTRDGSKNSFDFITGYDNLEPHAIWGTHTTPELVQPLDGYPALSGFTEVQIPILMPGILNTSTALQGYWTGFNTRKPGLDYMSLWGGNITGVATPFQYLAEGSVTAAAASTSARITFKSTSSTVILAWGGHIAREQDWGTGLSAGGISGSSYHTRLLTWSLGNLGNQDRSLQAAAVIPQFNCDFTATSPVCLNTSVTVYKTLPLSSLATYTWSIINISGANPTPLTGTGSSFTYNSGTSAGSFTLQLVASVPFLNTTITQTCTQNVTVNGGPSCSIVPSQLAPYCPASTQTFTGPPGMSSYAWSITGNGTISGVTDQQSVSVLAGDTCNTSFTLSLQVTNEFSCSSSCSQSYLVNDVVPPVFTGCPADPIELGCNPTLPTCTDALALVTASDLCSGAVTPTCSAGTISSDGCLRSQTFTLTATDACTNSSTCEVVYNWTEDVVGPVFTGCPADPIALGCNPTLPTCTDALALVTASDLCSGAVTPTCSAGDIITTGCSMSQTFTLTATDACTNSSTCEVTYIWTDNPNPPTITGCPLEAIDLGCNPVLPTCTDARNLLTITGSCGEPAVSCSAGLIITSGCVSTQDFVVSATDGCDHTTSCTVTYTWTTDVDPPVIANCPVAPVDLGLNPVPPVCDDALALVTISDVCSVTTTCQAGEISSNLCDRSQVFTITATDGCENVSTCEITYIWIEDTTPPEFSGCPTEPIDLGCNPVLPTCGGPLGVISSTDGCSGPIQPVCAAGQIIQDGNNFSQTFTISLTDGNGNTATCQYTYIWQICNDIFCSYTQGFWGQTNGVACNGLTAPQNLANLLTTPIILGKPSNNRSYTIGAGQVQCVTDILPASGKPAAFGANYSCTTLLKNTLFGQTLTLALNMRYDNIVMSVDFGSLQLPANGVLSVAASPDCNAGGGVITRTIPANVMDYLAAHYTQTVLGVFNLCNDALGNYWISASHPSFADVNMAVSAINEAYDKCGSLTVLPSIPATAVEEQNNPAFDVKIVPNPFRKSTTISVTSESSVDFVTVEVYNLIGQKISELYHGSLSSGIIYPFTFEPGPSDQQGMYQLVVKSDSGVIVKKMIYLK
ncbi:MAG: T9SS type A sorting domain-containing protein [Syntrophothermus sp.]